MSQHTIPRFAPPERNSDGLDGWAQRLLIHLQIIPLRRHPLIVLVRVNAHPLFDVRHVHVKVESSRDKRGAVARPSHILHSFVVRNAQHLALVRIDRPYSCRVIQRGGCQQMAIQRMPSEIIDCVGVSLQNRFRAGGDLARHLEGSRIRLCYAFYTVWNSERASRPPR